MNYSFFTFFTVSRHIPGPVLGVSHFARCSVFLGIFQVQSCEFLIFLVGQYSCHILVPMCTFIIFHVFQCFSPKSRFYSVYFSFFMFFTVSRHIPGPTVCVSQFSCFSVFLALFHVLSCEFLILIVCQFSRPIQVLQFVCLILLVFSIFFP